MKDIRIYSVQNMIVRDGFITDGEGIFPYYQKIDKKENHLNKYQSFFYKLKILFRVFQGKYSLVEFEKDKVI